MKDEKEPRAKRGENAAFQRIIDECGEEYAKRLIAVCPAQQVYIPLSMNKGWKRDYVLKHFNGSNVGELARELKTSANNVRRILDSPRPVVKAVEVKAVVVEKRIPYIGRR